MRILFFGASELGFQCCNSIIKNGFNVVGIFTIPREFSIKYRNSKSKEKIKNYLYKDFHQFEKSGISVFSVDGKLAGFNVEIQNLKPDLIIVVSWYYLIPEAIISLAANGAIGIHASLLPKYRGNAPLVWAMINGESETGVSLFYIEKGVDKGAIIAQKKFNIDSNDTIKDLLEKARIAAIAVLNEALPKIKNNSVISIRQDHSKATTFPKRTPQDGLIDWSWDVVRIENFIKAQTKPYPGAFTYIGDKKVIIWDAEINKI
ncbi:MAG: methionyl-tRNA formyltransferase [Ekhidna sp.]|nr:methionyl-tRNA formyltransferase [Ekhidna sp.]